MSEIGNLRAEGFSIRGIRGIELSGRLAPTRCSSILISKCFGKSLSVPRSGSVCWGEPLWAENLLCHGVALQKEMDATK